MRKFKGFIFDVDDTILDNKPGLPDGNLHEQSRMEACMTVAEEMNLPELLKLTPAENNEAFVSAAVHSMEGAVWNILLMKNLVAGEGIDYQNEILLRIVRLKDELHERRLLNEAEEVPGAIRFIKELNRSGYKDKLAVASSATRRDIDLFFGKTGLDEYFPPERIKSKEDMKHTKPHPEVFNLAFGTLGLSKDDKKHVLAFEDDPRGIMSAVAAGLQVCAITRRFTREELERLEIAPNYIIDTFEEAWGIVGLV